jgi:hypothetical protein
LEQTLSVLQAKAEMAQQAAVDRLELLITNNSSY